MVSKLNHGPNNSALSLQSEKANNNPLLLLKDHLSSSSSNTKPLTTKIIDSTPLSIQQKLTLLENNQSLFYQLTHLSKKELTSINQSINTKTSLEEASLIKAKLSKVELFLIKLHINGLKLSAISQTSLPKEHTFFIQPGNNHLTIQSPTAKTLIQQALRQLLPLQSNLSPLVQFSELLTQLPSKESNTLLPQSLKAWAEKISALSFSKETLNTAKNIEQAFKQVNNLNQTSLIDKNLLTSNNLNVPVNNGTNNSLASNQHHKILSLIENLLHQKFSNLTHTNQSNITIDKQPNLSVIEKPTLAMTSLLQLLGLKPSSTSIPISEAQQKLLLRYKALIEGNHAKNQILKLSAAENALDNKDTSSQRQLINVELPLKFQQDTYPLSVIIYHKEHDDSSKKEEEKTKKEGKLLKSWHVDLSFDLPNKEKLHASIDLNDNNLNIGLWAESKELLFQTKSTIHSLEKTFSQSGFNLDHIHCHLGKPPHSKNRFSSQLIDTNA